MRTIGDFNFAINFEPTSQKILDSRLKVATKTDLTTAYPNKNYYPKMVVTVEDENALYMLTGDGPTVIDNWTKLVAGDDSTVNVENTLTSSSTTNALSAAMGKKLNDEKVAKTTTVNGKPLSSNVVIGGNDIEVEAPSEYGGSTTTLQGIINAIGAMSDDYVTKTQIGNNNGVASLDDSGKVPSAQLPSYVDDVLEYDNRSSFPGVGQSGIIYIAKDTNLTYRWSGSTYVEISPSLALGETSSTAYAGDKGARNADNISKLTDIVIGTSGGVITDSLVVTTDPEDKYSEYEYITIGYGVANSTHPNNNPELKYIHIPAASTTKAGCMTVSDKNNITNIINSLTWQTIE